MSSASFAFGFVFTVDPEATGDEDTSWAFVDWRVVRFGREDIVIWGRCRGSFRVRFKQSA